MTDPELKALAQWQKDRGGAVVCKPETVLDLLTRLEKATERIDVAEAEYTKEFDRANALEADRDAWKARAEQHEKRIAEIELQCDRLIARAKKAEAALIENERAHELTIETLSQQCLDLKAASLLPGLREALEIVKRHADSRRNPTLRMLKPDRERLLACADQCDLITADIQEAINAQQ